MLAVVGRGMKSKIGISGQIFRELGRKGINIRTISQGADELSILIGVGGSCLLIWLMRKLHK